MGDHTTPHRTPAMAEGAVELYEDMAHVFVVKIWLEEKKTETGRAAWRGHITHVVSGERTYFEDPDAIADLVVAHLECWGVDPPWPVRLRRWLMRVRR